MTGIPYNDRGLNLSRGNIPSLFGAIGGIISIFLPWFGIGVASWKELYSLHELSVQIGDSIQLSQVFGVDLSSDSLFIVSILTHYWILFLVLLVVCCYFSIQGGGTLVQELVGTLHLLVLYGLYIAVFIGIDSLKSGLVGSLFHFEYGFYISLLCALVLIFGANYESGE